MTIPSIRAAELIQQDEHPIIEQVYSKVLEDRAREHAQEIEQGAIRTWIGYCACKSLNYNAMRYTSCCNRKELSDFQSYATAS